MVHSNFVGLSRLRLAGMMGSSGSRAAVNRRRPSGLASLWFAVSQPFYKSIYIRFQYAFGFAALGLVLMAAITLVSGRALLNSYESSVAEARFELMPAHSLQVSLREVEHLAYLYVIEADRSATGRLQALVETIARQFQQLSEVQSQFATVEHAHSDVSVPDAVKAWQSAHVATLKVFDQVPGSTEAVAALTAAHNAIDPVYNEISNFHRGSMEDLQLRLGSALAVARWTYFTIFGAILAGLTVLIALGVVVGRSVLQPISKLQVAAQSLSKKDFSHRVRLRNNRDELGQLGRALNVASIVLQRLYRELERRSTLDGLTGALNRAAFDTHLSEECARADRHEHPLSLLMVDIDFFKHVNDNYGHQTGDQVLRTLVSLLNAASRPGDVVARYGGEEFAIIFPETDAGGALAMAERIRQTIEAHAFTDMAGETFKLTVSVGCASWTSGAMTPHALVRESDAALYRAKKTGRNRVVSAPAGNVDWSTAA
ncbi:MAG: diguanylate cyclase [Pseudolabrys sp.]|nr:diguanylate cyclase [Pseudolabrys sp.]